MEQDLHTNPGEDRMARVREQRAQRRRKRRLSAFITILGIVLLTGAIILILNDGGSMLSGLLGDRPAHTEAVEQAGADADKYTSVTIAAVGSISISDHQLADARTADGYDFSPSFFGAADLLSGADLTVADLECNFAGSPYGTATASAPNVLADNLAGLGVDLLQTANCASIANGMAGLESTIQGIERAGMRAVGTFASAQDWRDSSGMTLVEVGGIRVAFVAFTKGLGNMSLPENSAKAVNLLYTDYDTNYSDLDTAGIASTMDAVRKQNPDVIIALVHWGSEYSREVSDSQTRLARLLYENGADAIIGTHSHMVGPIDERTITLEDGTEKDVVTAYDLGDFYTDSTKPGTQTSMVLRLTFTRNNWNNKIMLSECRYEPLFCADLGASVPNRYQVLGIENAIALYEQDYVYRVNEETYERLKEELAEFPGHIAMPEEE